jgi:predicted transport protein
LDFTTILDLITPDEEEEIAEPVNRDYWEKKAIKDTVKMADVLLSYIDEFVKGFTLNYNKHYIGLIQNEASKNFVRFCPRKIGLQLSVKLKKDDEIDEIVNNSDLNLLEYSGRDKQYHFKLQEQDLTNSKKTIVGLFRRAYESYTGNKIEDPQNDE